MLEYLIYIFQKQKIISFGKSNIMQVLVVLHTTIWLSQVRLNEVIIQYTNAKTLFKINDGISNLERSYNFPRIFERSRAPI